MTEPAPAAPPRRLEPTDRADAMARNLSRDIGTALEQARRAAGFTRNELARKLGVSGVTLLELERGSGNPTLARLARYAEAYGVTIDVIARPTPHRRRPRTG